MSNATQYQFDLIEVAEMLVRKQGITEGLWSIGVNFGMVPVLAGPEPSKTRPSMIVSVDRMILVKGDQITPMTIDASKLKPV